jgi:hypothetical protein
MNGDATYPLALLSVRRKWPRRRSANQRDELPPLCMTRKQHIQE